jgi:uncharacterized FAD-dependent dehydrogenase
MKLFDLIIVGAGPAGVLAAKTVAAKNMSVLIIERGYNLNRRRNLISGWFGHGLHAMNRLELKDDLLQNTRAVNEAFKLIQRVSLQQNIKIHKNNEFCRLSEKTGVELATYLFESISSKAKILFGHKVKNISKDSDLFVVETELQKFKCKKCLLSTGKNSIEWISQICQDLNINVINNSVKLGVRVEVPTFKINQVVEDCGDIKADNCEDSRINSFVSEWEDSNIVSAFGHGLIDKKSRRTNFMVGFDVDGVNEAIRNVKIINVLANDKVKKERIEDFMVGKSILTHLESFGELHKTFKEIEKIFPSFINYAIMYVPEIRLKGVLPVDSHMRTEINNLYGAGECTSRVNTLIGAMASGLISAKTILKE